MENTKYASQNMPIPGSAQLFTQKKNAMTAFVCSWNLRGSCDPQQLPFLVPSITLCSALDCSTTLTLHNRTLAA